MFKFIDTLVPDVPANINSIGTYLLIVRGNQQEVSRDMKERKRTHYQLIAAGYNLILCLFFQLSREYASWKVGGLFFIWNNFALLLLRENPPYVARLEPNIFSSLLSLRARFPGVFLFDTTLQVPDSGLLTGHSSRVGSLALKAALSRGSSLGKIKK